MSLATSAKLLLRQDKVRAIAHRKEAIFLAASECLWSETETSEHVTKFAENMIRNEAVLASSYTIAAMSPTLWHSVYVPKDDEEDNEESNKGIQHGYGRRVRSITLLPIENSNGGGYLVCSCRLFERMGLPCRHIIQLVRELRHYHCELRWSRQLVHVGTPGKEKLTRLCRGQVEAPPKPGPYVTREDINRLQSLSNDSTFPAIVRGNGDKSVFDYPSAAAKEPAVPSREEVLAAAREALPFNAATNLLQNFGGLSQSVGLQEHVAEDAQMLFDWVNDESQASDSSLYPFLFSMIKFMNTMANGTPVLCNLLREGMLNLKERLHAESLELSARMSHINPTRTTSNASEAVNSSALVSVLPPNAALQRQKKSVRALPAYERG